MNLDPLKAAVKLVADVVSDTLKSVDDQTTIGKIGEFLNIMPDILNLLPQIGEFSVSGLSADDYVSLVEELASDLEIPQAHAANVVNASLTLIENLIPNLSTLVNAIKATPTQAKKP